MRMVACITAALVSVSLLSGCEKVIRTEAGRYEDLSQGSGSVGSLEVKPITPLRNPDRGFFVESNFLLQKAGGEYEMYNPYVKTDAGVFTETDPATVYAKRMNTYAGYDKDSLTLVQQYIYLSPWVSEDLDATAIALTKKILDALGDAGLEALLRFAYSYDRSSSIAGSVTLDRVRRHISQLEAAGIFSDYKGRIATLQAGFFGDWGEWAGASDASRKGLIDALLGVFPDDYSIGIRYPADKRRLGFCTTDAVSARIGYNNDYFTAGTHRMAPGNDYMGEDYDQVAAEAAKFPSLYVAGELPQQEGGTWGLETLLPVTGVLKHFKEHRYSSFDVSQNYNLNIASWKNTAVSASLLRSYEVLFDESYFLDGDGKEVARSLYDFVRDHLGYRLNLSSDSSVKVDSGTLVYNLSLTNTGFAAVTNPKEVYLVLVAPDGTIAQKTRLGANPTAWVPWSSDPLKADVHNLRGSFVLSAAPGTYRVGIWMPSPDLSDTSSPVAGSAVSDVRFALNGAVQHWWAADKSRMVNLFAEITF